MKYYAWWHDKNEYSDGLQEFDSKEKVLEWLNANLRLEVRVFKGTELKVEKVEVVTKYRIVG